MKTTLQLAAQICRALLCFCCHGTDQNKMAYLYKGFDTNGILVVKGILSLSIGNSNRVQGGWNLQVVKLRPSRKLDPQIGSGKLAGEIHDSKISLNLNPGWFDNNVRLNGQVTATNISGEWGYYGFAGKIVGGKFEAAKK